MNYVIEVNVSRYFEVCVDAESLEDAQSIAESLYADVRLDEGNGCEFREVSDTMVNLGRDLTNSRNSFSPAPTECVWKFGE